MGGGGGRRAEPYRGRGCWLQPFPAEPHPPAHDVGSEPPAPTQATSCLCAAQGHNLVLLDRTEVSPWIFPCQEPGAGPDRRVKGRHRGEVTVELCPLFNNIHSLTGPCAGQCQDRFSLVRFNTVRPCPHIEA